MPAKKTKHNRHRRIKWFTIAIFMALLPITIFWLDSGNFILHRDEPDSVVLVFTLALMRNKERQAKSLVAEETWPQLDSWFETHRAKSCHFLLDADPYMMDHSNRSYDSELNQYFYEYSTIDHPCFGSFYFLSVKNIVVAQDAHGWQIIHWEDPCDTRGFGAKECWPWD